MWVASLRNIDSVSRFIDEHPESQNVDLCDSNLLSGDAWSGFKCPAVLFHTASANSVRVMA